MLILAIAPPLPIVGKIIVALIMLGLMGVLVRTTQREPLTSQSIGLAVVGIVGVLVALEALFPDRFDPGLDGRGVLAAMAGAVCGVILLPPARRTYRKLGLACIILLSGPLGGFLLALKTILLSDVPPLDRKFIFAVSIGFGVFAGLIASVGSLIAVPSEAVDSETQDKQS